MQLKTFVISSIAVVGIIAGVMVLHHPEKAVASTEMPRVVAVAKVERQSIDRNVNITAELQPYLQINIFAKVPGYLKTINVDVGDKVKAGQVIAELEVPEEQADVAHAQTVFDEQKLEYDRIKDIIHKKPGLLAQDEVDKAKTSYDVAKAGLDHAKVMAGYAVITAPFDGVITKRTADNGALIQAGTSSAQALPLVHLADEQRLRLILPVSESIVPDVKVGTMVAVTVPAIKKTINAPISRCSGQIDSATRTMEVEVDLDNPDMAMTPGMYANAAIQLERHANALTIPVQALSGKDKPNVWVVDKESKIVERPVTVGIQTADKVEILDGLQEGDQVVFGARNSVAVGSLVKPKLMKETL